jgi:hypothetical protein
MPPINSYHRLLAHKMAEYYRLTHVADSSGASVRMFRGQAARMYESQFRQMFARLTDLDLLHYSLLGLLPPSKFRKQSRMEHSLLSKSCAVEARGVQRQGTLRKDPEKRDRKHHLITIIRWPHRTQTQRPHGRKGKLHTKKLVHEYLKTL